MNFKREEKIAFSEKEIEFESDAKLYRKFTLTQAPNVKIQNKQTKQAQI